jgi:hypothetical protein
MSQRRKTLGRRFLPAKAGWRTPSAASRESLPARCVPPRHQVGLELAQALLKQFSPMEKEATTVPPTTARKNQAADNTTAQYTLVRQREARWVLHGAARDLTTTLAMTRINA